MKSYILIILLGVKAMLVWFLISMFGFLDQEDEPKSSDKRQNVKHSLEAQGDRL